MACEIRNPNNFFLYKRAFFMYEALFKQRLHNG